ncbi:MAG TPA: hypothetical protein VFW71_11860 [Actinomycetota bacterium]|nr:hypothetical protein [Actinomycetota bacterium]
MADEDGHAGEGVSRYLENTRNLLGLLLAGFIGALNFVGLKSGEVTTILRNEAVVPSFIAALLLFALMFAVSSVFVASTWRVARSLAIALIACLVGLGSLTVVIVPIPGTTTAAQEWISTLVGGGIIGVAVVAEVVQLARRRHQQRPVFWVASAAGEATQPKDGAHTQLVLLLVGAMLAAVATYSAIRLEARSQSIDPVPQGSASVTETAGQGSIELSVSATRLRERSYVAVRVTGLPRGQPLAQACAGVHGTAGLPCPDDPCHYLSTCDILDGLIVSPDDSGAVNKDFVLPFSAADYQHIHILLQTCEAQGSSCSFTGRYDRLDIAIPAPGP